MVPERRNVWSYNERRSFTCPIGDHFMINALLSLHYKRFVNYYNLPKENQMPSLKKIYLSNGSFEKVMAAHNITDIRLKM